MAIEIPGPLLEEMKRGRCSLFLGAGASREAGFPGGQALAEFIAERAKEPIKSKLAGQDLATVAQFLYDEPGFGRGWVYEKTIEYFEELHRKTPMPPSEAHRALAEARWRTAFTTNYDLLLEQTYQATATAQQRLLPIFTPDASNQRFDERNLRYFKLNGSIDEAKRNSHHTLVFTFAEQQDGYSKNELFYNILREEAVNGPIVFVGFSFTHPGATGAPTSPEFLELRELLRVVGAAARWHYLVTPLDAPSVQTEIVKRQLNASRIHIIDAKMGDFVTALRVALGAPASAVALRPPNKVTVGPGFISVQAEDYEKDRRHFDLLGSLLDNELAPRVEDSLNGKANWASFAAQHRIVRRAAEDFERFINPKMHKLPHLRLLVTPTGWGKTFLLRDMAVNWRRQGRPVFWLNPLSSILLENDGKKSIALGTWDSKRLEFLVGALEEAALKAGGPANEFPPIIIADNCAERLIEALGLFDDLAAAGHKFQLLAALRDYEFEAIARANPIVARAPRFEPKDRYSYHDEARAIVDLCKKHNVSDLGTKVAESVVLQRILEDPGQALIYALQIIFDKQHRPFAEIVKDFWRRLPSGIGARLALRVAAFHRMGNSFGPRLYSLISTFPGHERHHVLDEYAKCVDNGVLIEREEDGEPCVFTLHPLVAEKLLKVADVGPVESERELLACIKCMRGYGRDLELIRQLLKRVTDYEIPFSSDGVLGEVFEACAEVTERDWVVCQQYAKHLLSRGDFEAALIWSQKAIEQNSEHAPLYHTKGNVLRRWGQALNDRGMRDEAAKKFDDARAQFSASRIKRLPDEYAFVTHLDMLIYLLERESDADKRTSLLVEGVSLYQAALRSVPRERYNWLTEQRYWDTFHYEGEALDGLVTSIEEGIRRNRVSEEAVTFLADHLFKQGGTDVALARLRSGQGNAAAGSPMLWIKEAELLARLGRYSDASARLASAKQRAGAGALNPEVKWSLHYWDAAISFVLEDYGVTRTALEALAAVGFQRRQMYPRGYIWKTEARAVSPHSRNFRDHALLFRGRIARLQGGDSNYGQVMLSSRGGDPVYLGFNPRYMKRRDLRVNDSMELAVVLIATGLRAEDPDSRPFTEGTADDLFVGRP